MQFHLNSEIIQVLWFFQEIIGDGIDAGGTLLTECTDEISAF